MSSKVARGVRCQIAFMSARDALEVRMNTTCPSGACNVLEEELDCRRVGSNPADGYEAAMRVTYSCKEPANCQ
ncbi:hypothetical protein [Myxococcus sp. CA039A]|uniref:hypothetical protein n=1 Tax=Myxococcus sp. CA039A TaxID=2741737 RepID=UPI00157ADEC5|nr:hypothetical protein [Myxococcus sp. CA039A]NTX54807.1 hypothetical protein [Myxococcus sp. CA039A]